MVSENDIEYAASLLKAGKLVAFPTETVYGLGANALDDRAVAEIYALKGRPTFNPLIVHFPSAAEAQKYVQWNGRAEMLAKKFWPGPLTLVLPRRADCGVSLLCSAGLDTLAVRVPAHRVALDLLKAARVPVAAPSANKSGRVSPTLAAHVREEFGDAVFVLDGGACSIGLESTVVDLTEDEARVLRPGAITQEMLMTANPHPNPLPVREREAPQSGAGDGRFHSPGMLEKHYAPSLPVRLNVMQPKANEALLAFGPNTPKGAKRRLNLSERGDLIEAAANLFAHLRALDKPEFSAIAVMPIPDEGIGIAINDRLKRAAT